MTSSVSKDVLLNKVEAFPACFWREFLVDKKYKMADFEEATDQLSAANSDLYDAEIDSDNEAVVNKDGGPEENGSVNENGGNHEDKSDEEDLFYDNDSGEEESLDKIKQKAKKFRTTLNVTTSSTKEPKKRKAKKEERTTLHSETQRLVRESRVKLPYYQPESKVIRHFLKIVPVENNSNNKQSRDDEPNQDADVEVPEKEPENLESDNLTTTETKTEEAIKPKLSGACDPFFFDNIPSKKPPGLNHLVERFFKHNKSKLKHAEVKEINKVEEQTETSDVVEVTSEVEKLQTADASDNVKSLKTTQSFFKPGDNLRSVKEQLQANMKLQRAEVRKIHETQRKLDNEEISDEEEEEDFEEDEDSDFEIEEWNADDVKAQEERSLEENETNDAPCDEESNSIADSDTNHEGLKTCSKIKHSIPAFPDEKTIDLFPSDNSNQTANCTMEDDASDSESVGSEQSIKLRLDSIEDTQDGLTHDGMSGFTKLKTPDDVHDQSSDASNLPNGQGQSGMNKTTSILDRSSSNDALTPFSRLLSADRSYGAREKSKPISELTLPVEDSQDLYDEDDVDKRFSDGLSTSKDFGFALDEDTQFTQFVDTQGYLLSATKKKTKEDQKSKNMSELLRLSSRSFTDDPKENSGSHNDMSELLGLCSGKFSHAPNAKAPTESQDNMNELLGLCSGSFTDKKKNSESDNMSELLGLCSGTFGNKESTQSKSTSETQNMNELLGLCSGKFNDAKKTTCESESQDMNELLGLCSGKFDATQKTDPTFKSQNSNDLFDSTTNISVESESTKKDQLIMNEMLRESSGQFNSVGSTANSGNEKPVESKNGIFSELGENARKKPKSKQGLSAMFERMKDDASSMDDVLALCSGKFPSTQKSKDPADNGEADENDDDSDIEVNSAKHSDVEDNSENSDNDVFSDDERRADSDDETEEDELKKSKKYGITYGKKVHSIFNKDNFVDEEAELSGSEASSDEEEGSEDDELEEDSDVEDLPSDEELQRQVNKVHLKSVIDEDKRELRELKERYLEDGDLYSENGGRSRNFKWHGLEDSQLDMFDNKVLWGEDEIVDNALLSEAELERRKMKHERDQFLQERLAREGDSQPTDVDESSQNILNLIRNTSSAAEDEKIEIPEKPAPKRQDSTSTKLSQKRGSFLTRSKHQMTRLSSITSMKQAVNSARGFVFHAISPSSKAKENSGKKLQRSASLSEPPNPKRPRLDRTLSNNASVATGSLFTAMAV